MVTILAAIGLIGIIVLGSLNKDLSVITPITTTLIGWLIGVKNEQIMGKIAGVFKRNK